MRGKKGHLSFQKGTVGMERGPAPLPGTGPFSPERDQPGFEKGPPRNAATTVSCADCLREAARAYLFIRFRIASFRFFNPQIFESQVLTEQHSLTPVNTLIVMVKIIFTSVWHTIIALSCQCALHVKRRKNSLDTPFLGTES